jgi:hypothetical protein
MKHENEQTSDSEEGNLHRCFTATLDEKLQCDNNWYIDSGATAHMCGDKSMFIKLDEEQKGHVRLANGQRLPTAGVGEIFFEMSS